MNNKTLKDYNQKRDFSQTKEPKGRKLKGGKALKFVVQYHLARREHYDFRLEWKGELISFAVPKGLSYNPKDKRLAVMVEPHPLDYAEFEGTIPKGQYGGGTVMLWDKGTWEPIEDFGQGLKNGSVKIMLKGERLKGAWAIIKLKKEEGNWLIIKEKDSYAKAVAGISKFTKSVKTGRSVKEIELAQNTKTRKNPFDKVTPQLAILTEQVPNEKGWIYEIKFDGYRLISFAEKGKIKLKTRNNVDYTSKFPKLCAGIKKLSQERAMVLDGEVIVSDKMGRSDFQALQNHLKDGDAQPIYMVFDLLALDGKDLRQETLLERKKKLKQLLIDAPSNICYTSHIEGKGKKFLEEVEKLGLEGIVGKRESSTYSGTRDGQWIKIKCYRRQEFIVGGFTRTNKNLDGISALLVGVKEGDELKYTGRVGTGFDFATTKFLFQKFKKIISSKSPFKAPVKKNEKVVWLKPQLVAEVQFAEMTKTGQLRQASFKGLREDKKASEVVLEEAVKLSSPEKAIYKNPKVTKKEIYDYYTKISKYMLPLIENRPLSVVRVHEDVKNSFFKKHPMPTENVERVNIKNSEGESKEYFYINSLPQLQEQVQLGSVEFHVWASKAESIESPDYMVFDLDPDKKLSLTQVRQGVKDIKKVLDKLKLKSFLKTSGGKGYHIVVPFSPTSNWQVFHDFAENVAKVLERQWPQRYTTNIRKNKREGKIFVDFMRNTRGATSVAPYSLRARKGAKVSMPLAWSELDKIAPDEIGIQSALARASKNPWRGFNKVNQSLNQLN